MRPVGVEGLSFVLDGVGAEGLEAGEVYSRLQLGVIGLEWDEAFRERFVVVSELFDGNVAVEASPAAGSGELQPLFANAAEGAFSKRWTSSLVTKNGGLSPPLPAGPCKNPSCGCAAVEAKPLDNAEPSCQRRHPFPHPDFP